MTFIDWTDPYGNTYHVSVGDPHSGSVTFDINANYNATHTPAFKRSVCTNIDRDAAEKIVSALTRSFILDIDKIIGDLHA